jgi:hypothetical protein
MCSRIVAQMALLSAMVIILAYPREMAQAQKQTAQSGAAATVGNAVKPKPLSETTQKGLAYLVDQQDASGGWGQGGGWRQNRGGNGRVDGSDVKDIPDLGNTCIATLALIRAGNTPQHGPYARQVALASSFICDQVDKSNIDSLYLTDVRDTQLQSKIGQYVDTFLAGLVLSELKGKMPADGSEERVLAALDKTVGKIERNQKADGTFAGNTGWASILSQGLCSKFLNRAAQAKVAVKDEVLNLDYEQTLAELAKNAPNAASSSGELAAAPSGVGGALGSRASSSKRFASAGRVASAPAADAGVRLYSAASNASRINDFGNTNAAMEEKSKDVLASKTATPAQKKSAQADLMRIAQVRGAQQAAVGDVIRQLDDKQFIAGFGNNGGEEFLSYMNISEMLVTKRGPEWERWDNSIRENLERVQNRDGSWSGQHCITGRTFCTAAALLTLMADRAPLPLAVQIQDKAKDKN